MRSIENVILKWVLWTLFFALILGGVPWGFPGEGRNWIQSVFKR